MNHHTQLAYIKDLDMGSRLYSDLYKRPQLIHVITLSVITCLGVISVAKPAYAYIGPGITGGSLLFLILLGFSALLAFYALIWFPIRRRLRQRFNKSAEPNEEFKESPTGERSDAREDTLDS